MVIQVFSHRNNAPVTAPVSQPKTAQNIIIMSNNFAELSLKGKCMQKEKHPEENSASRLSQLFDK